MNDVLEDFKSKVGQHIEILDLEQFGKSLFIDGELQVAENDEHLYSSTFVNSGLKLNPSNDKTAITAIIVNILFFLMKSIMNINNLFIKFSYKIINI